MVRTQIQLPEAQYRRLKAIAQQRGVSLAALIRELLDHGLRGGGLDRADLYRRASSLVGAFRFGDPDLASEHDRRLQDAFE